MKKYIALALMLLASHCYATEYTKKQADNFFTYLAKHDFYCVEGAMNFMFAGMIIRTYYCDDRKELDVFTLSRQPKMTAIAQFDYTTVGGETVEKSNSRSMKLLEFAIKGKKGTMKFKKIGRYMFDKIDAFTCFDVLSTGKIEKRPNCHV